MCCTPKGDVALLAHTRVNFWFEYETSRFLFLKRRVHRAHFEVNYSRPSHFALESEIELAALAAEFAPEIEDPQIDGMGEGPYSRDGFMSGWNFGNTSSVRSRLSGQPDDEFPIMPQSKLHAAWSWNYRSDAWVEKANHQLFVPAIEFVRINGVPSRVAVWPTGMPIFLPKVDHVMPGRLVGDERCYGLAPWSEVLDLARRAGFDTTDDPLTLAYFRTPDAIAKWFAEMPLVDLREVPELASETIIDAEVVTAAIQSKRYPSLPIDERPWMRGPVDREPSRP